VFAALLCHCCDTATHLNETRISLSGFGSVKIQVGTNLYYQQIYH